MKLRSPTDFFCSCVFDVIGVLIFRMEKVVELRWELNFDANIIDDQSSNRIGLESNRRAL